MLTTREKRIVKNLVVIAVVVFAFYFLFLGKDNSPVIEAQALTADKADANTNAKSNNSESENAETKAAEIPAAPKKATIVTTQDEVVIMSPIVVEEGGQQVAYEMSHNVYVEEASTVPAPETYVEGGSVTPDGNQDNGLGLLDAEEDEDGDVSSDSVDPIVIIDDEDGDDEIKAIVIDAVIVEDDEEDPVVDYGENVVDIIEEDPEVPVVEIDEEPTTDPSTSTDGEEPTVVVDEGEVVVDETPNYTELARDYVGGRLRIYTNDVDDMETVGDVLYLNYDLYY